MDELERKEDSSLPPDYVSLAQLQERWIKKQQEHNLKEKEEEERKERESRTQNEDKNQRGLKIDAQQRMPGLSPNDAPRRRVEKKYGREIGVTEDKGKGKETVSENGEKKKKKKKNKNGKKKSAADGQNRNGIGNEKSAADGREGAEIVIENEVKVGKKGVLSGENSGNNGGLKGIEQIVSVKMVEVLPDVKTMDLRGGLGRNRGNGGLRSNNIRKANRVRVNGLEKKMENGKGYGKKWRERRKNDESCYRLKENNRDDVLKGDELEPEVENKAEDEISKVCHEMGRNKTQEYRIDVEDLNDNAVEIEKKVDDGVLANKSVRNVGNGYRRYGNGRGRNGRNFSGLVSNDGRLGKVRSDVCYYGRFAKSERFEGGWHMKRRESGKMWVKKEEKSGTEVSSYGVSEDQA